MNLPLNERQEILHQRALEWAGQQRRRDSVFVEILTEIDAAKLFKRLGHPSLIAYATDALGLTEPVAYTYISVARKAATVALLKEAVQAQSLSVWKASRLVSVINDENAQELIEFAKAHRKREVDFEIRRRNPKAETKARVTPISGDRAQLNVGISTVLLEELKRVLSIASQKKGETVGWEEGLAAMKETYLDKYDPVRKAERAIKRMQKSKRNDAKLCPDKVAAAEALAEAPRAVPVRLQPKKSNRPGRVRLKAREIHAVKARDGMRCTFVNEHGERCKADRWLASHHIIQVSRGGTNDPSNMTTLCTYHHELVHQLALPIDGMITWLRSPQAAYVP